MWVLFGGHACPLQTFESPYVARVFTSYVGSSDGLSGKGSEIVQVGICYSAQATHTHTHIVCLFVCVCLCAIVKFLVTINLSRVKIHFFFCKC